MDQGFSRAKLNVPEGGGISFDERFFLEGEAFRDRQPRQVRLRGGDASGEFLLLSA